MLSLLLGRVTWRADAGWLSWGDAWNGATRPWGMGDIVTRVRPAGRGNGVSRECSARTVGDGQESFHGALPFLRAV